MRRVYNSSSGSQTQGFYSVGVPVRSSLLFSPPLCWNIVFFTLSQLFKFTPGSFFFSLPATPNISEPLLHLPVCQPVVSLSVTCQITCLCINQNTLPLIYTSSHTFRHFINPITSAVRYRSSTPLSHIAFLFSLENPNEN